MAAGSRGGTVSPLVTASKAAVGKRSLGPEGTAEALGIKGTTLQARIKKQGIVRPR